MGLGAIISSAVEAVRAATESDQVDVVHRPQQEADALGAGTSEGPLVRQALVQEGERIHHLDDGRQVTTHARIVFFPAADGEAPPEIGPFDELVLPSGYTGPIVEIPEGPRLTNPATGAPYSRTVWLG